jgi:hypothetical protein
MDDMSKRRRIATRVELPDVVGRVRPHHRHQPLDRLQHAGDAAERQGRGAEADDLAILGPVEAPHDLDRIGGRIRIVEIGIQLVERRAQRRVTVGGDSNRSRHQWLSRHYGIGAVAFRRSRGEGGPAAP